MERMYGMFQNCRRFFQRILQAIWSRFSLNDDSIEHKLLASDSSIPII